MSDLNKKVGNLQAKVDALEILLNMALEFQVANRGTEHAFYSCYTMSTGKLPAWVQLSEAFLKEKSDEDGSSKRT